MLLKRTSLPEKKRKINLNMIQKMLKDQIYFLYNSITMKSVVSIFRLFNWLYFSIASLQLKIKGTECAFKSMHKKQNSLIHFPLSFYNFFYQMILKRRLMLRKRVSATFFYKATTCTSLQKIEATKNGKSWST